MVDVTVERAGQSVTVLVYSLVFGPCCSHILRVYERCAAGDGDNISDIEGRSGRDDSGHQGGGDHGELHFEGRLGWGF